MTPCIDSRTLLDFKLGNPLSQRTQRLVVEHIESCRKCKDLALHHEIKSSDPEWLEEPLQDDIDFQEQTQKRVEKYKDALKREQLLVLHLDRIISNPDSTTFSQNLKLDADGIVYCYLNKNLPEEDLIKLDDHFKNCRSCKRELNKIKRDIADAEKDQYK